MTDLAEALRWALAELRGETQYKNEGQRTACFARADDALAGEREGLRSKVHIILSDAFCVHRGGVRVSERDKEAATIAEAELVSALSGKEQG